MFRGHASRIAGCAEQDYQLSFVNTRRCSPSRTPLRSAFRCHLCPDASALEHKGRIFSSSSCGWLVQRDDEDIDLCVYVGCVDNGMDLGHAYTNDAVNVIPNGFLCCYVAAHVNAPTDQRTYGKRRVREGISRAQPC